MNTALVTGATSGIGYAVAQRLLSRGWRVLLAGRTAESCEQAALGLKEGCPGAELACFPGDLMNLKETDRVAGEILRYLEEHCDGRLQALINNAGCVRSWYATTKEGYEQQFALNHLAGFLLTHRLMGALQKAGGKMILTGSGSHKRCAIHWEDVMYQRRRYSCLGAYKQSKLCGMLFAKEFNRRFAAVNMRAYVVDPGLVKTDIGFKQTGGLVRFVWRLRQRGGISPQEAAQTYGFLCEPDFHGSGLYYTNSRPAPYDKRVDRPGEAQKLFEFSEKLCGIEHFGEGAV